MVLKVLWRPVGYFGIAAIVAIFFSICQLSFGFAYETPFLGWAGGFLALELIRQVVVFYWEKPTDFVQKSSTSRRKAVALCLASFLVPPVGLFAWLKFDAADSRMARQAGRCGVRGALLFLLVGGVIFLNGLVTIANQAIADATIHPVDLQRGEKLLQEKKRARLLKKQA